MREKSQQCTECAHTFHAEGPCTGWDGFIGGFRCECKGTWYGETRDLSGFCYILVGTSVERGAASHAACPGKGYVYPCQCECHDDSFTTMP